ncbi:MAG: histidine--tRNA ligase [Bacteroidota bacterium]
MKLKPSIPKGTRDFSPIEMVRRNYILDTIRTVYQKFGFQQIETPAMENLKTLTGKYGDEGDKLLFRILNSGNFLENVGIDKQVVEDSVGWGKLVVNDKIPAWALIRPYEAANIICERALRYDLTVPFARYVVMNQNEITFPFKRYQIQPVWRADRPQKGRYREFVQCDADVIGSDSLLNEVEMVQMIEEVFSKLKIETIIKINNRKILIGIVAYCGCIDKLIELATSLDKYDKIGEEGVIKELENHGFSKDKVKRVIECVFPEDLQNLTKEELMDFYDGDEAIVAEELRIQESQFKKDYQKLNCLIENFNEEIKVNPSAFKTQLEIGLKGVEEIKFLFRVFDALKLDKTKIEYDTTLARGLNYYTGAIFEVKVDDSRSTFTSSILGGGRYDDLTGIFGLPNVSGVGISFGVDRIYDVMEEMKLFDQLNLQSSTTQVMFVNFGKEEEKYCLKLLQQVRAAGINAEIYPDSVKMKKQMSYADDKKIPFVILVGSEEMKTGELTMKNMQTGTQEKVSIEMLIEKIKTK